MNEGFSTGNVGGLKILNFKNWYVMCGQNFAARLPLVIAWLIDLV